MKKIISIIVCVSVLISCQSISKDTKFEGPVDAKIQETMSDEDTIVCFNNHCSPTKKQERPAAQALRRQMPKIETVDTAAVNEIRRQIQNELSKDISDEVNGKNVLALKTAATTTYRFGLIKKHSAITCSHSVVLYGDDEDDETANKLSFVSFVAGAEKPNILIDINENIKFLGAGGVEFPRYIIYQTVERDQRNTQIRMCVESAATLPLAKSSYMVIALDDACPAGSIRFRRYIDMEDSRNETVVYSSEQKKFPGLQETENGNLYVSFCYKRGNSSATSVLPEVWGRKYYFIANALSEAGIGYSGEVKMDNEDDKNQNKWIYKGTTNASIINEVIGLIVGGEAQNTHWMFNGLIPGYTPDIYIYGNTSQQTASKACKDTRDNAIDAANDKYLKAGVAIAGEAIQDLNDNKDLIKDGLDAIQTAAAYYGAIEKAEKNYSNCLAAIE